MTYGVNYQGSKSRIAKDILSLLPKGKRFVDLFGGGFAMSHAALLDGWEVYYNDINPLCCELVKRATGGEFKDFKPEWVSREEFFAKRDTDPYIACVWSFGGGWRSYLYGRDREEEKKLLHDFVVNGERADEAEERWPGIREAVTGEDWHERRKRAGRIQHLEHLEHLERLERLEHLEHLEINCGSYEDYEYRDGDVVYCDPPYGNGKGYRNGKMDVERFRDWAASRPYPVYCSEYEMDDRFEEIWSKPVQKRMCVDNRGTATEKLFWNGRL